MISAFIYKTFLFENLENIHKNDFGKLLKEKSVIKTNSKLYRSLTITFLKKIIQDVLKNPDILNDFYQKYFSYL